MPSTVVTAGRADWLSRLFKIAWWCFLEARPTVQGVFMLRFLAGASFAGLSLEGVTDPLFWGAAAVWACVTLSVYILNGAMDVEEDRINRSSRPIARGDLTRRQAISAVVVLLVLSVAGSLALGSSVFWSVASALALGWLYSGPPFHLKRWPAGLAAVATLGGLLTYYAGYAANGGDGHLLGFCIYAAVTTLWMGLVGQTKDLSDIEGDKQVGRRSWPVRWGEDTARLVLSGAALTLGVTYVALSALFAPDLLATTIVVVIGALAVTLITLGPWSKGVKAMRRRPYRAFMVTQYLANLVVLF